MTIKGGQHQKLREMHKKSVSGKVLDYWAERKQHRAVCLVGRTASATGLSEEEIKDFFRELQEAEFGRYIKSSKGHPARFAWGTKEDAFEYDYSLIAVGRASKGEDVPLDGYFDNPDEAEDEDEDEGDDLLPGSSSRVGANLMKLRGRFKGLIIRVELPADFDPETDLKELNEWITFKVKYEKE